MLKTLWNRKLTIIVCVVVCVVAAALAYSKLATPTYQSSALVQINAPSTSGGSDIVVDLHPPRPGPGAVEHAVQDGGGQGAPRSRPRRPGRPGDRHGRPHHRAR